MKKVTIISWGLKVLVGLSFLLPTLSGFAQTDLFYTIRALRGGLPLSLDSIVVENLSTHQSFSVGSLPSLESYKINLTKGSLEGHVTAISGVVKERFGEWQKVENTAGRLVLASKMDQSSQLALRVFDLQGRCVQSVSLDLPSRGHLLIEGGRHSMYLVQLITDAGSSTYRFLGKGDKDVQIRTLAAIEPLQNQQHLRDQNLDIPSFSAGHKVVFTAFANGQEFSLTETNLMANGLWEIRLSPPSNTVEVVDLDLRSGLKWASCNVGATQPWETGEFFAWGATIPQTSYGASRSLSYNKSIESLRAAGIIDSQNALTSAYDAATANWGADWRMPTKADFEELLLSCDWKKGTLQNAKGYFVTSKTGKSIFLPETGFRFYGSRYHFDEYDSRGNYWTSSVVDDLERAETFVFSQVGFHGDPFERYSGLVVRPVTSTLKPTNPITPPPVDIPEAVDLGLPSGRKWASFNVGASAPWESGRNYAWSETQEYKVFYPKDGTIWGMDLTELTTKGIIDSQRNLTAQYDAATVNLGDNWRMPTVDEIEELIAHCSWSWEEQHGVFGKKATGRNGNSIFFPTNGSTTYPRAEYWSSTLEEHHTGFLNYNVPYNSIFVLFVDQWEASKGVLIDGVQRMVRPVLK